MILVIDDDDDIRETVLECLVDSGHAAVGASGAMEALEMLGRGEQTPALILLDLMMPGMNGGEFRAEQLKDPALARIPVIVLSADANAEAKAAELGAAGCLKKPVRLHTLLEVVRRFAS